jgi:hypothetical protein
MGSLGVLCCGIAGLLSAAMGGAMQLPDGRTIQQDPTALAIGTIFAAVDLIASGILLACGIGALSLRPWARSLGIIISVVILAIAVGRFVATLTYTGEKLEQFMKQFDEAVAAQQKKQGGNAPPPPSMAKFMSSATIGFGVAVLVLEGITPLLILLLWTKPNVKAAFAGQLPAGGPPGGPMYPSSGTM